ncbi:MAG: hypothetical protein HKUEN01_35300 [Candidatus Kuenenia stuttgartiensis]|nr:MAG: hypothetical protein HKUEN01_35300 [Candidatus Kuenenia stuttgartiensis]
MESTYFRTIHLEALPFKDETFDFVTGFNSFQYAGSFSNALAEAKRVLKTNGKMVICIWDKAEASEATTVLKAIGSLLPPPPPGTPGPFALSEDGKVEQVLQSLNLKLISKERVSCPFLYYSHGDGIKSFMSTGPAASALNFASKKLVEQSIAEALKPYHLTEDLYYLQNSFLLFLVEK